MTGVILHKGRYTENGKVKNGFRVRWHVGDEDFWYDVTHITRHYNHTHTHTESCMLFNRSYKQLVGCLVSDDDDETDITFVDDDWRLISQVICTMCVCSFTHTMIALSPLLVM